MPKIEVNEELFFALVGKRWGTRDEFELALSCAKAELDEDSDKSAPLAERILKIELNDTNRPDLWSTAGCARQLRIYHCGKNPFYPFFSLPGDMKEARKKVEVEASVQKVRPFLAGFVATGNKVSDASLCDLIQTQEKLAGNFGRKRSTVSMGIYRSSLIKWPIHYRAVAPDSVSFVPLQWDSALTLSEILKQHPKGKEYAYIQENEPLHPLLVDAKGGVLSYPPIINSADIGAVKPGDSDMFIELTGTDMPSVALCASIVACDLADQGWTIEPVEISSEFETPFGKKWTSPFYFQAPVFCSTARVERYLGEAINGKDSVCALERMGVKAERTKGAELYAIKNGSNEIVDGIRAFPPVYRNDFLHAADVMEDVMIGRGLSTFAPQKPNDFTIGRLSEETLFSRKIKGILTGLGFQEMIYNYLGSKADLIDKMEGGAAEKIVRIENPMSENYEYVRNSIIPYLLESESVSANAAYPHKIFEVGKVAYKENSKNYGVATRQYAGILHAANDANFNTIAAAIQTLFYYISREYTVKEVEDSRFIAGRSAVIAHNGKHIGIFGEIHPQVLENHNITVPCTACEFDVDVLITQ
ncbi:MAG: phenylalanine--tRNA ligase subunit beta [Termitinemataceae bacterium]|nr:MAG: phenylalanine--tRNA ligase subunit beta [Termitinemataceae bacterium]